MLSVSEALAQLLAAIEPVGQERIPLGQAAWRVLAEEVASGIDSPPFTNSSMDGFAVRAGDIQGANETAPRELVVIGDIPAGSFPRMRVGAGQAARIMTGALLPEGADAVVPVEMTDVGERHSDAALPKRVQVMGGLKAGDNIRKKGDDFSQGAIALRAGRRLRPQDMGLLAMLGVSDVPVYKRPRVALLSTGDELLGVEERLAPGKIRESNSYALGPLVESCGCEPTQLGIARDDREEITIRLDEAVKGGVDMIITSAGVSVGAYDHVRTVVEENGRLDFWRVKMKPGKPLVFGEYRNVRFVGLPGNPVSSFVGFEVFLRPALNRLAGVANWRRRKGRGRLLEPVESSGRETYLRVVLIEGEGIPEVRLTGQQGSGNLFSLVQANGLAVIPADGARLEAGDEVEVWWLD